MERPRISNHVLHLTLSEGHYNAIGRIAAHWNSVEHCLQAMVWTLQRLESETGRHITASLRTDTLVDFLRLANTPALVPSKTRRINLEGLLKRFEKVRGLRNDAVHAIWIRGDDIDYTPNAMKLKAKNLDKSRVPYTVSDLEEIYEKVHCLYDDLALFIVEWRFELKGSIAE